MLINRLILNKLFLFVFIIFFLFLYNLKKIDNYFLKKFLRIFFGKFYHKEIWEKYNQNNLNYKWIRKFNFVVHGIDEIKINNSCKLDIKKEFNLYEINVFNLDNQVSLSSTELCPLENILDILKIKNNFIVIDIKDDFALFSKKIFRIRK